VAALRRAGRAVLWAYLVAALALCAVTLAPRVVGWSALVVRSGSMGHAVPVGSLVVVRPVPGAAVERGDPVVVQRGSTAVLHRVVAVVERDGKRYAQLQGDANAAPDPELDRLDGRVATPVAVLPWVGYAVAVLAALAAPLVATVAAALALHLILRGGRAGRPDPAAARVSESQA
jgi:signal peptidase